MSDAVNISSGATSTNSASSTSALSEILQDINLGPADSIQFMFAKLQLAQSQICKNSAETYMKQIEEIQQEQSQVAEMIAQARKLQNDAKAGQGNAPGDKKASLMPEEMAQWMKARDIPYDTTGNDLRHNYDEWTYNIESLTNYQESISNKTQTLMVYLQDFISQYNSYLQGASSAINNATQVLTAVATGR